MATAAGCQLVASCDLAYASTEAKFATPGVNIGLFCSTPMVALSRVVGRKQAMEMLLSGVPVNAETAAAWGLINHAVPSAELDSEVEAMARLIASKSSYTLKVGKEAFYRQLEMGLDEAYAHASRVMTENMLAMDASEGIDAFLERRPPVWRGC
jgi:enoyl-CoA hydratase/carnithine racemase